MTLLALTFLAALGSGLIAGFFLAFSACVMAALGRIPPASGISAMQSVNVVVLNPVFLGTFFGTAALSLVLAVAGLMNWAEPGASYLLAGSLLYLIGSIVVTMIYAPSCSHSRLENVRPARYTVDENSAV